MYKEFDWAFHKKEMNPVKYNYLKNYWDKDISEDQFISDWKQFKPFSRLQEKKKVPFAYTWKKLSRRYSPSSLRKQYGYYRNCYGFFISNNKNI
jgi:hypothetical protein